MDAVKVQQRRLLQSDIVTQSDGEGTPSSGPIFNGPISGRNVLPGTHVTAGTVNFNFS